MWRHTNAIVALFFSVAAIFAAAIFWGSALVALCSLLAGIAVTFVLAIAWMRPAGYPPEHHPKIDRLFDDTAP